MTMRWVDLKNKPEYLKAYVALRNKHVRFLLTEVVSVDQTRAWMRRAEIEVFGLEDEGRLAGVAVVYLDRRGEIAFFVDRPNRGIGTRLLRRLALEARRRNWRRLWAWVLEENAAAVRVFEKSGFSRLRRSRRLYRGIQKRGIILTKTFVD